MSGGHYQYAYQHIKELADDIDLELAESLTSFDEHREKVSAFRDHLYDVAECAKELEWWISGDSDETDFLYKCRKLK